MACNFQLGNLFDPMPPMSHFLKGPTSPSCIAFSSSLFLISQETHAQIRKWLAKNVSPEVAQKTRIMYGGSANQG